MNADDVLAILQKQIKKLADGTYGLGEPYISPTGNLIISSETDDVDFSINEDGELIVTVADDNTNEYSINEYGNLICKKKTNNGDIAPSLEDIEVDEDELNTAISEGIIEGLGGTE